MKVINKISEMFNKLLNMMIRAKAAIMAVLGLLIIGPTIYITRYSFPAQDDFDYANNARTLMEEGYSLIGQAAHVTADWHMTWGGLYSSTFFGYLFSGIVMCDPKKVCIFEFCSAVLFFVAFGFFIYCFSHYIFKLVKKEAITVFTFATAFIFAVAYFGDFDVFYWFITSVQYLMLLSFMFLGAGFYILAGKTDIKSREITYMILSSFFAILAAGANLCISALNLFWFALICLIVVLKGEFKERKWLIITPLTALMGSMINGLAPGNYKRAGGGKSLSDLILAVRSSVRFVLERIEMYLAKPEFWIVLIALILATLFIPREKKAMGFNIKYPIVVSVVSIGVVMGVIFPAMLGYRYDVFTMLIRGQVVLDMTMFTLLVFNVLLIEQWLFDKYGEEAVLAVGKDVVLALVAVICGLALQLRDNEWRWVGIAREYRDLDANRFQPYTDYFLDILRQVDEAEGEIAVVYVDEEVIEKTTQINPLIGYDDCYDPEERYLNNAIAHFYKKKGVWVLHSDYAATEDDYKVAKKYGVESELK